MPAMTRAWNHSLIKTCLPLFYFLLQYLDFPFYSTFFCSLWFFSLFLFISPLLSLHPPPPSSLTFSFSSFFSLLIQLILLLLPSPPLPLHHRRQERLSSVCQLIVMVSIMPPSVRRLLLSSFRHPAIRVLEEGGRDYVFPSWLLRPLPRNLENEFVSVTEFTWGDYQPIGPLLCFFFCPRVASISVKKEKW